MKVVIKVASVAFFAALVGCVSGDDGVDALSPEGCKIQCEDLKASDCYDAPRYDSCREECDLATSEEIDAWLGCLAGGCDPQCKLIPGGTVDCDETCDELFDAGCISGTDACVNRCQAPNVKAFEDCIDDLPATCDSPTAGDACVSD